jgi:hypothetical protein
MAWGWDKNNDGKVWLLLEEMNLALQYLERIADQD